MQDIGGIAAWLDRNSVSVAIVAASSLGSFLVGLVLIAGQLRYRASASRLERGSGIVREAEILEWMTKAGNRKSAIKLAVDFQVDGVSFCCRRWELYGANLNIQQPIPPLRPGDPVRIWFDRKNPEISALVVGQPSYVGGVIALVLSVFLAFMATRLAT